VPLSFLRRFLERKPRSTNAPSLFGTSYGDVPKEILSPKTSSARDLCNLFSATSFATVLDGDQPKRYNVSATFGRLNDEELQTVATIGFRSHGFRNLTADEVMTLATITRMEEFRREDRFL
jgi:hypothetical protein